MGGWGEVHMGMGRGPYGDGERAPWGGRDGERSPGDGERSPWGWGEVHVGMEGWGEGPMQNGG